MENQHRLIKTYRELNQTEIDLMNQVKVAEAQLNQVLAKVQTYVTSQLQQAEGEEQIRVLAAQPNRWLSIAKTHFDQGFMAAVRSVAQPLTPQLEQSDEA